MTGRMKVNSTGPCKRLVPSKATANYLRVLPHHVLESNCSSPFSAQISEVGVLDLEVFTLIATHAVTHSVSVSRVENVNFF